MDDLLKVDFPFIYFRLIVFVFVMTLIFFTFYLIGTSQSFLETTLSLLFVWFRYFSWGGLLMAGFFQVFLMLQRQLALAKTLANLVMLILFFFLYVGVEFLKTWLYPGTAS